MIISHLELRNWRNFREVEIDLSDRVFIVGPNASGKSNILDAIRFLRDIVKSGGGLQQAVQTRGGVSRIRSLFARSPSDVEMVIEITDDSNKIPRWRYEIGFSQIGGGIADLKAKLKYEKVRDLKFQKTILNRPDEHDKKDDRALEYTHLEQINLNAEFRPIVEFFQSIEYMHLIPQLLRDPRSFIRSGSREDVYGRDFLEKISLKNKNTQKAFLKKIQSALQIVIPEFSGIEFIRDKNTGTPHLEIHYTHWRAYGAKQREDQFSDGTLRFIGFFWLLLDGTKPILLEEPELSLHPTVVAKLPAIIAQFQKNRQVILTTHSPDLLADPSISSDQILLLYPSDEGTKVRQASSISDVNDLMTAEMNAADVVIPATAPKQIDRITTIFA